jgi:putative transposase
MKRREIPGGLRFVTFSCEHQLPLLGHPAIRDLFVSRLAAARSRFAFSLIAWVVMPEHAHLLVLPSDEATATRSLQWLKQSVAQRVVARWRELDAPILREITRPDGRIRYWQKGGGFDRNVRNDAEMSKTIQYIHRNPVERMLVEQPQQWTWSSVRWWMGKRGDALPCDHPPGRRWEQWRGFV